MITKRYKTDLADRVRAQQQRELRKQAGVCIAGPLNGTVGRRVVHGPPEGDGGRCRRCMDVRNGVSP